MENQNQSSEIKTKIKNLVPFLKNKWFILSAILVVGYIISYFSGSYNIFNIALLVVGGYILKPWIFKKNTDKSICPHCKEEVNPEAAKCPHCHGKIYRWTPAKKIILIMILISSVYLVSNISSTPTRTTSNVTQKTPQDLTKKREIESIVFAKHTIEGVLKSPSTAKFSDVKVYELSNLKDVWAINGYVDSQNSYGAMMRSIWEVQLDYRDGKGGTVKSILFDGDKIL